MGKSLQLIVCVLCVLIPSVTWGQAYKFKTYGLENGLPQPFIYTVDQDPNGFLWIGTGDGIAKYDGFKFEIYRIENNLAENFITTSYTDSKGNLWLGHNQGGISFYNHRHFIPIDSKGISSAITDIKEDKNGNLWFATQNSGLLKIDKNFNTTHYKKEFESWLVYSFNFTASNEMLLGTNDGLYLFSTVGSRPELKQKVESIPSTKIQCIVKKKKSTHFWVGTEDAGLYQLMPSSTGSLLNSLSMGTEWGLNNENVQSVLEDSEANLWISTYGKGVHRLTYSKGLHYNELITYNTTNGISSNFIKTVFQDREGNIWIGTYGGGLSLLGDDHFVFYPLRKSNNNVLSIFIKGSNKWFGLDGTIVKTGNSPDKDTVEFNQTNGLPLDKITALYVDNSETLWAGTEKSGLYKLQKNKFIKIPLTEDKLSDWISGLTFSGDNLWIATKGGAYALNIINNTKKRYSTDNGLRHNNINDIYSDLDQNIWITTHANDIVLIKKNEIINYKVSGGEEVLDITSVTQDKNKNLWLATYGNGIFLFSGSSFKNYTTNDGLKTNYCYSIITDKNNTVWIGHRGGMSKFDPEKKKFTTYGVNEGITSDFNFNAVAKDHKDNIWFGTTQGAIKYDPSNDKKNLIAPNTNIISFYASDEKKEHKKGINLKYEVYKLKFEFIGLSYKNPENVMYRYKLEGYDLDWSEPTKSTSALYTRVEDGEYTFKVKACNSDGVCSTDEAQVKVIIASPIWKQWWFVALLIVSLVYVVYIIIQLREKEHKKIKVYLQQTLEERTYEVRMQKEALERQNKDITDSINYAKRIQEAILPDFNRLKEHFPESFIFYQPKDIVSGDFYWFKKVGNKFIIACADATGHGVPGAFMSLIGSTLLKEITDVNPDASPADILGALDIEVKNILKQHGTGEDPKDGMDMSVCEFDLDTKELRIASAMRPIFLYHGGEWKFVKGDRISIGGGYDTEKKEFTINSYKLSQGDIVYMFTDGYTDQFGGYENKKIKLSGLESLIKKSYDQPMMQQHVMFKSNFNSWRKNNEQIDDVLMVGIKI